jgi:hypothetical protein
MRWSVASWFIVLWNKRAAADYAAAPACDDAVQPHMPPYRA